MPQRHHVRTLAAIATSALLIGASSDALASGFAAARFGGEHGNPTESNPTALYYNPGGIGLSNGTHLTLDLSFVWRDASYERFEGAISADPETLSAEQIAANTGEGTLDNFLLSPMAGITTDFGLDLGLVAGFAFYAPFGGSAVWDEVEAPAQFPGAEDGPARWYTIEGSIQTLAYTFGVAYFVEPARLSLGISANVLQSSVNTIRARNADGTDNVGSGEFQIEGRSLIDVESTDWSLGAGVLWEPLEDQLWVGLSYQSAPNLDGEQVMEGTLQNLLGAGQPTTEDIKFTTALPDIYRLGVRYRPMDRLELRLFGDYTRWSRLDQQCIVGASVDNLEEACATTESGAAVDPEAAEAVIQVLQRRWEDAFGVRLSGSYWVLPEVELIAGGGYDGNAIPDSALEPALFDMNKYTASLGVRYEFLPRFGLMVTATNVFYSERDTRGVGTAETFEPPSTQPSSEGVYNQNIFLVNANLEYGF